jgi:hypothetical protein
MSFYKIHNAGPPLANINPSLVNVDDSHLSLFTDRSIPNGPHTLPAPGNNVQSAAGIYQKGGRRKKINRTKINKISNKYKMRGNKKSIRRRIKSRILHNISRRNVRRTKRRRMRGGAAVAPAYPAGYSQFNSNRMISNNYSVGGPLSAADSALANPPIKSLNAAEVDNLNHNEPNAYGKTGAGSGFPSRGWF